jgi:hypothetical protein
MDWFNALPKLSRTYAAILVCTAACISWRMDAVYLLLLDWRKVFYGLQARCKPGIACTPLSHENSVL